MAAIACGSHRKWSEPTFRSQNGRENQLSRMEERLQDFQCNRRADCSGRRRPQDHLVRLRRRRQHPARSCSRCRPERRKRISSVWRPSLVGLTGSGANLLSDLKMVEKISYRGWKNAYRISNATVELIVLADVGPRIIWYGFVGGDNILHEVAADAGLSGGSEFHLYGGHRLWVSPEVERTYFPISKWSRKSAIADGRTPTGFPMQPSS